MNYIARSLREIEEELKRKKAEKEQMRDALEKLYFANKIEFLKEIDRLFEQGKLDTLLLQTREYSLLHLFPLCKGEQRICNNYPERDPWRTEEDLKAMMERRKIDVSLIIDLDRIREALFRFYGDKCVRCGISYDECIEKYGRPLELHHVHPISFGNVVWSVNPVRSFVPLCPKCHLGGAQ